MSSKGLVVVKLAEPASRERMEAIRSVLGDLELEHRLGMPIIVADPGMDIQIQTDASPLLQQLIHLQKENNNLLSMLIDSLDDGEEEMEPEIPTSYLNGAPIR